MRLLLAGGGTGGHLFPAVAIAEQLLRQNDAAVVRFVGTARGLEAKLLPKLGMSLELIDMVGVVGRGLVGSLQMLPKLFRSLIQSLRILRTFRPDIVIGVGGYASFPVLVAARLKGVPFILHEQNAKPGLSNRVLAQFAARICISIPGSESQLPREKTILTGNPLRQGVTEISPQLPAAGTLLVFGGSRGARAINDLMIAAVPMLRAKGFDAKIVHQTGEADAERVREACLATGEEQVDVRPFIDDMANAYRDAKLVVCRAGATTIAELCACGRPALMIPFPFAAADHQTANAQAMEEAGAAKLMVQKETSAEVLATTITALWQDQVKLTAMAVAAASLGQKDAAEKVLNVCQQVLSEG